jgi:hypothetical protein
MAVIGSLFIAGSGITTHPGTACCHARLLGSTHFAVMLLETLALLMLT